MAGIIRRQYSGRYGDCRCVGCRLDIWWERPLYWPGIRRVRWWLNSKSWF